MATLKELIQYSRSNPTSDVAKKTRKAIEMGLYDEEAAQNGIDLSWAGRGTASSSAPAPVAPVAEKQSGKIADAAGKTFKQKSEERAVGGVKGAIESTTRTAQTLQDLGQRFIALIDPTKSLEEVKASTGFKSLQGEMADQINDLLEAKTPEEKQGKIAEFALELLWPVGKTTEVASAVNKGKKVVQEGVEEVSERAGAMKDKVVDAAGDIKEKGGKVVEKLVSKPIPRPVENVLRETDAKTFDKYSNVAKKATESFKNPTPLETVGDRAVEALDQINRKLSTIGKNKRAVLERASVGNKSVGNIVVKFRQELQNAIKGKMSVEGDEKLYKSILDKATTLGNNPSAKQVDEFIDFVQDKIYTGGRDLAVPITDNVEKVLRPITGRLNTALKNQLPDSYRTLNQQYSEMVDVLNELNVKLGKEGEKGGALMKRVFSPSDARTKELFQQIEKITGIDLVNEATLARFLMETMGDARQASLLEQLQLPKFSKTGIFDFALDKITSKFNTPEAQLERARELLKP